MWCQDAVVRNICACDRMPGFWGLTYHLRGFHTRKQREGATVAQGKAIAGRIRVSMAQGAWVAILGDRLTVL